MPPALRRRSGAALIAVLSTLVFKLTSLAREGGAGIGAMLVSLLATGLVGYLAWPGIENAWTNRETRGNAKRLVMIGLGLALAFVLSQAVDNFAGQNRQMWSFMLLVALLAALFVTVLIQSRRARRP